MRGADGCLHGCRSHHPPVIVKRGLNCGSQAVVSETEMWNYTMYIPLSYHHIFGNFYSSKLSSRERKSTSFTHYIVTFSKPECVLCVRTSFILVTDENHPDNKNPAQFGADRTHREKCFYVISIF
jgi:hypothetical protein